MARSGRVGNTEVLGYQIRWRFNDYLLVGCIDAKQHTLNFFSRGRKDRKGAYKGRKGLQELLFRQKLKHRSPSSHRVNSLETEIKQKLTLLKSSFSSQVALT
jgi:hypothetical protein